MPLDEFARLACFGISLDDDLENYIKCFGFMSQAFKGDIDFGFLDHNISDADLEIMKNSISDSQFIILYLFSESMDLSEDNLSKINQIISKLASGKKTIMVTNISSMKTQIQTTGTITINDLSIDSIANTIIHLTGKNTSDSLPHN